MRSTKISAVVLAGLLSVTLAACGDDDAETETAPPSESAPSAPAGPVVLAELPDLSNGVSTAVTLDPAFLEALTTYGLTPGVLGETTLDASTGVLTFPITGGNATAFEEGSTGSEPFVTGLIRHDGQGITLTAGTTAVSLENFDVDPGSSMLNTDITVAMDGEFMPVMEDVPTFFLDGSTLEYPPTMEGTNAILQGTTVSLTETAAGALSSVFGVADTPMEIPAFFPVGVATITLATQ